MLLNKLEISDYIRPVGIKDTYPTHLDIFGKGGCHSVQTIQDRDAITTARRSEGMYCYIIDTLETYTLLGGTKNSNWYKVFGKNDDIFFNMHAKRDYVLLGDANEKVSSSSLLIDLKNSFIEHLRNSSRLTKGYIRLGNYNNQAIETKRIDFDNLPYLNKDYIFLGGNDTQTQSSSLLIDLKNSFIEHVRDSKKLTKGHLWLGDYNNRIVETSTISFNNLPQINKDYILLGSTDYQVVSSNLLINLKNSFIEYTRDNARLKNGYLWLGNYNGKAVERKNIGLDNLPQLGAATFPIPSVSDINTGTIFNEFIIRFSAIAGFAYLPNPTFDPLSIGSWIMGGAWLPQTFTGNPGKVNPTSLETIESSSLALTIVSLARAHKLLDNSQCIVGSRSIKFKWDNQIAEAFANTIPSIAKLYGYQNTYNYGDKAQVLDELDRGLIWNSGKRIEPDPVTGTGGDSVDYKGGQLRQAVAGDDYIGFKTQNDDSRLAVFYPKTPDLEIPAPPNSPAGTLPTFTAQKDVDRFLSRSNIIVTQGTKQIKDVNGIWSGGDYIKGIDQLRAVSVQAYSVVSSDDAMISMNNVQSRKLILFDYNDNASTGGRRQRYFAFKGAGKIPTSLEFALPTQLPWIDPIPVEVGAVRIDEELQKNVGYVLGIDSLKYATTSSSTSYIDGTLKFTQVAPQDATYILVKDYPGLSNSVSLEKAKKRTFVDSVISVVNSATGATTTKTERTSGWVSGSAYGLLKKDSDGSLIIANGGTVPFEDDYVTPGDYQILNTQVKASAAAVTTLQGEMVLAWKALAVLGVGTGIGLVVSVWNLLKPSGSSGNTNPPANIFYALWKYPDTDDLSQIGKGNLLIDMKGTTKDDAYRPGLRLTAFDSSTLFDNPYCNPISMGIFGYTRSGGSIQVQDKNPDGTLKTNSDGTPVMIDQSNYAHGQEGFIWESAFENNNKAITDTDSDSDKAKKAHYRFPINFALKYVGHNQGSGGWNRKSSKGKEEDILMNYDYYSEKFDYNKVVRFNENIILTPKNYIKLDPQDSSKRIVDSETINSLSVGTLFLHTITI